MKEVMRQLRKDETGSSRRAILEEGEWFQGCSQNGNDLQQKESNRSDNDDYISEDDPYSTERSDADALTEPCKLMIRSRSHAISR